MRRTDRYRCLTAGILGAATLAFPSAALGRTIVLNWTERTNPAYNYPRMTFTVRSVTVTASTWMVRASFANHSAGTIQVTKGDLTQAPPQYPFGLTYADVSCPPRQSCLLILRKPVRVRPAIPRSLRPGQGWSGTWTGRGVLPRRMLIYVSFGAFVTPGGKQFDWLTEHAFRL